MSADLCPPTKHPSGFTLIEVVAALVIFAGGVLMVLGLSGTLGDQMRWAAAQSEIVVKAQEHLDSLESLPFDSLTVGTTTDTLSVQGSTFEMVTTISTVTALLLQLDISVAPGTGVRGPSYGTTSYAADIW